MRAPFTDRREDVLSRADILPRSLRDLLAAEVPQAPGESRRRRRRRIRTARRAP